MRYLLFIAILVTVVFVWKKNFQDSGLIPDLTEKIKDVGCVDREEVMEMADVLMTGTIDKGEKFKASFGWYKCHAVERNDIVLLKVPGTQKQVVKIVRALKGDRFEVVREPITRSWALKINSTLLMYKNKPYFFGDDQFKPTLQIFEKSHKQTLGENEYIVFSGVPPGFEDSSNFGIVSSEEFVAKVIPLRNQ